MVQIAPECIGDSSERPSVPHEYKFGKGILCCNHKNIVRALRKLIRRAVARPVAASPTTRGAAIFATPIRVIGVVRVTVRTQRNTGGLFDYYLGRRLREIQQGCFNPNLFA